MTLLILVLRTYGSRLSVMVFFNCLYYNNCLIIIVVGQYFAIGRPNHVIRLLQYCELLYSYTCSFVSTSTNVLIYVYLLYSSTSTNVLIFVHLLYLSTSTHISVLIVLKYKYQCTHICVLIVLKYKYQYTHICLLIVLNIYEYIGTCT